jgi:predicted O-methyltransferase YrrM
MNITETILNTDKSLTLHNEGEWSATVSEFSAFNDAGLEAEVGEYLYGLLRVLKPEWVLETGSHVGIGASYLGSALKQNKKGHLDTIEFLPELHKQAKERVERLGLNNYVTCHFGDVKDFTPQEGRVYDFILLDTEPQTRFAEFEKFYPYLKDGGFVFIHDLHRHLHQIPNEEHGFSWPFGTLPSTFRDRVHDGSVKLFHLPTPRGLTGMYKTHPEDYNFNKL